MKRWPRENQGEIEVTDFLNDNWLKIISIGLGQEWLIWGKMVISPHIKITIPNFTWTYVQRNKV